MHIEMYVCLLCAYLTSMGVYIICVHICVKRHRERQRERQRDVIFHLQLYIYIYSEVVFSHGPMSVIWTHEPVEPERLEPRPLVSGMRPWGVLIWAGFAPMSCACACVYKYIYIYTYIYMYVRNNIYIYIYIYTYS